MDKERAHAEARTQLGRVVGKRWRLDRVLGAGSLGAVYAGTHRSGRLGALKLLPGGLRADAHFRERFLREAYLANLIEHPGVLPILDDGEDEVGPFLVMDLLDGWSLADKLRTTSLPLQQVLNIAAEILRALAAAHRRGIVHRDVKPSNIFLCRDGAIKLLDFGTARVVHEEQGVLTRMGLLLGTPAYMAPEVARGDKSIDGRADLYSLAATLFHAVAGKTVHLAPTSGQMLGLAATTQAAWLSATCPDLNPGFTALVDRALAFDRDKRPRSAERWLTSVEAMLAGKPSVTVTADATVSDAPSPTLQDDLDARLEEKRLEAKRHLASEEQKLAGANDIGQTFDGGSTPSVTEPVAPEVAELREARDISGRSTPASTAAESAPVARPTPPSNTSRVTQKIILPQGPEGRPDATTEARPDTRPASEPALKPAAASGSQPTQRIWITSVADGTQPHRVAAETVHKAAEGHAHPQAAMTAMTAADSLGEGGLSVGAPSSRAMPSFRLQRWPSAGNVPAAKPGLGLPALGKDAVDVMASTTSHWPHESNDNTTGKHATVTGLAGALRHGAPRRMATKPTGSRGKKVLEAQIPLYVWFIVGAFLAALIWVVIVVFASMWFGHGAKPGL